MTTTEETQAMYELADAACRALGIDPDDVLDPVGPVTKREYVLFAMYKHAENVIAAAMAADEAEIVRLRHHLFQIDNLDPKEIAAYPSLVVREVKKALETPHAG